MRKNLLIFGLLSACSCAAADLPSDAEMRAIGEKNRGDFGAAIEKAQRSVGQGPQVRADVPPDTQQRSPVEKALIEETMAEAPNIGKAHKATGTELIVFVSFSMPDELLQSYSKQAIEAGANIVLRGMEKNSLQATIAKAYQESHAKSAWEVNPALFKKFKITKVPAIVLADNSDQTVEDGCAAPTTFLRVDGAVAIRQALLLMRRYGDKPLAGDAAKRLEKLEKVQ